MQLFLVCQVLSQWYVLSGDSLWNVLYRRKLPKGRVSYGEVALGSPSEIDKLCPIVISLNRVGCGLGCSHIQFTFHFGCCDNVKLGLVASCCCHGT